jgi:hypothetical protein
MPYHRVKLVQDPIPDRLQLNRVNAFFGLILFPGCPLCRRVEIVAGMIYYDATRGFIWLVGRILALSLPTIWPTRAYPG